MKNEKYAPHSSSLGNTDANIVALLSYLSVIVLGWIPVLRLVPWVAPLVIWLLEKNSRFVRFHAMQAIILNAAAFVLNLFLGILPALAIGSLFAGGFRTSLVLGGMFSLLYILLGLLIIVFAVFCMVKAYRYEEFHIPLVGRLAEKLMNSTRNY